jgi:glucose-1-phosphate cytidylyltransferase
MRAGDELVEEPFRRLIAAGQLFSYTHDGFWACMDTFKEMQQLDDVYSRGDAPWMVWNGHSVRESIAA